MTFVIDSSVFVAAVCKKEEASEQAFALLKKISIGAVKAIIPTTVLFEVVAAVSRRTGNNSLAKQMGEELLSFPSISIIDVTSFRVLRNLDFVADSKLAGMDAVVASIALEFDLPLITLDKEMKEKASQFVKIKELGDLL